MPTYSVYCHTNKTNGKRYYGITSLRPEVRWGNGNNYRSSRHFNFAIEKYGWDGFTHEVIAEGLTKEEACQMEQDLIREHKTTDGRYGYNLNTGGESGAAGVVQSAEGRARRSERQKGRRHTLESRKKMSEAAMGRTFSPETLAKMSAAKKGKPLSREHARKIAESNRGKHMSEEAKDKIRESKRHMMKPVYCHETKTTYESVSAAARALGVDKTNLTATCKGKHKHCGGYHFKYADE